MDSVQPKDEITELREAINKRNESLGKINAESIRIEFEYYAAHHKEQYEKAKALNNPNAESWRKEIEKDEALRKSPDFNDYLHQKAVQKFQEGQNALQPLRNRLATLEAGKSRNQSKNHYMELFELAEQRYKDQSIFKRISNKIQGKTPKWDQIRHEINTYDESKEAVLHDQMQQLYGQGKYNQNIVPDSALAQSFEADSETINKGR